MTAAPDTQRGRARLRRAALWLAVVAALFATTFLLLGGREGLILWYVRYFIRTEGAPTQTVHWQVAPSTAARSPLPRLDNALALLDTGAVPQPPNIVLIVADDLGIHDLTLHGEGIAKGLVPTPNINRLALQGAEFTTAYAGNATCSPSRAALLTGRYATRVGVEYTPVPVAFSRALAAHRSQGQRHQNIFHSERVDQSPPYEQMGLPTSEISLARLLKEAGYHTINIGKWHLGEAAAFSPQAHGFDETLGFMAGASLFLPENSPEVVNAKQTFDPIDTFLWAAHPWQVRFNGGAPFKPPRYLTDYFTDEALRVISANRQRPFFLYLAYNAPHTPLQAIREDYAALAGIPDHTRRVYGGMVRSLDRNIGRVIAALEAQGLADNTLVIFTSDNGAPHSNGLQGLNAPYRGWKATFFEGGLRVPYFFYWPHRIAPGTRYSAPVAHVDVFSTAATAAGAVIPHDRRIDGVNLLPLVLPTPKHTATVALPPPHPQLFWRSGSYRALRAGDWKLQVTERPRRTWLFNLAVDPTEHDDQAAREPARVAQLKAQLLAIDATQVKPLWPSLLEGAIAIDKPLNQPTLVTDDYIYWSN